MSLELKKLTYQLSEHLHKTFDYYIKCLKLQFYANKPVAFLAKQMKRQQSNKKMQFLTNSQGKCLNLEIANEFNAFYAKLYNLKDSELVAPPKKEDIEAFLSSIQLPSFSPTQLECLSTPLSSTEVLKAIKHLHLNKAPGPDGFSNESYR